MGNRFTKLLLVAIATFIFVFFSLVSRPALAFQTTLQSTAGKEILAVEAGKVALSSATVPTGVGYGVSTLGVTSGGTFVAGTALGIMGAGAIGVVGLTVAGVTALQNKAMDKYCQANTTQSVCGGYKVTLIDCSGTTFTSVVFYSPPGYPSTEPYGTCSNGVASLVVRQNATTLLNTGGGLWVGRSGTISFTTVSKTPWANWTQAQRDAAINLLTSAEKAAEFTTGAVIDITNAGDNLTLAQYGGVTSLIRPNINPDGTADDSQPYKMPFPVTIPNPYNSPDPNPSPSPSPSPTPTESPSPSPSPTPTETPEIPSIDVVIPRQFPGDNWLQHGINVFKNKFPFDIFGDFQPNDIGIECPTYEFFEYDFELCPIKDFFVMLKWPVIIGFLIWSYQQI